MKAAELMVGDLVCLKDDTKYELPLKVDGVIEDDISLEGDGFLGGIDGLIRPIPITPEILEKNEFHLELSSNEKNVYSHIDRGTGDCTPIIFLSMEQKDWRFLVTNAILKRRLEFIIFHDTLYVHQLQQVLRLAGMTELANNFKI